MMTLQQLDMNILLWIQEHLRIDALTPFWKVITFLGNAGWFWIVLAVALLVPKITRRTGIAALLSLAVGFLITNVLLKNIVARPSLLIFITVATSLPIWVSNPEYHRSICADW